MLVLAALGVLGLTGCDRVQTTYNTAPMAVVPEDEFFGWPLDLAPPHGPGGRVFVKGDAYDPDPGDKERMEYDWEIVVKPEGSTAELTNPHLQNPAFTIDLPGVYIVMLRVYDGFAWSMPEAVKYIAEP